MRLRASIRRLLRFAGSCPAEADGMTGTGNRHGQEFRVELTETMVTTHPIEVENMRSRTLTSISQKLRAGLLAIMAITLSMAAEPALRTLISAVARVA